MSREENDPISQADHDRFRWTIEFYRFHTFMGETPTAKLNAQILLDDATLPDGSCPSGTPPAGIAWNGNDGSPVDFPFSDGWKAVRNLQQINVGWKPAYGKAWAMSVS